MTLSQIPADHFRKGKRPGPKQLLIANILRARFKNGGLEYLDYFDGSYLEDFFHKVGKASYEEYVAKVIELMQKAARQGKIIAFTAGLAEPKNSSKMEIDESHASVESNEEARAALAYPLGIFLICAEKYSYFASERQMTSVSLRMKVHFLA